MSTEETIQQAASLLVPWGEPVQTPEPHRIDFPVSPADLPAVVEGLVQANWGYLSAITGLDLGVEAGELEALYHFCSGAAVLTLRVRLPREAPAVPTLCAIIPGACFFEREISEMFGVTVQDIPDAERLYLPDDWPQGVYPQRKDFVPGQLAASGQEE